MKFDFICAVINFLFENNLSNRSKPMPIFEFRCLECGEVFEKILVNSRDSIDLSCPKCNAENCQRLVSSANYAMAPGVNAAKAKITTKSCGGSNQCVTLDLPGHSR